MNPRPQALYISNNFDHMPRIEEVEESYIEESFINSSIPESQRNYLDSPTLNRTEENFSVPEFPDRSSTKDTNASKSTLNASHQSELSGDYLSIKRKLNSSLWESVQRNDIEMIKNLLKPDKNTNLTADVNAPGLNNWTALHISAAFGLKEASEVLIYNGLATDINAKTSMNRTPLHLATIHKHIDVVKLLVREGALIDLVDIDENTCLHYASAQGYTEIVQWLLRKTPDLSIKNLKSRTAVDLAFNYPTLAIFKEYSSITHCELPVTPYGRATVYFTLMHNSREDHINKLLFKGLIKPNVNDLKVFTDRPKLQTLRQRKKVHISDKIILPPSKVGPSDFKGLLQLGKGSFGEVYLVEKLDTLEQFALKVLRKEKVLGNNLVRYAFTERNILMTISHPFIVKLNYAFQTPEKLVMVMDFCPNGDLGTQLVREKKFTEEKAKFYIIEVLLALEELHKHGIIFRDLKPDNVVLDSEGHAKLTDFGLSKEGVGEEQLARSFCGSVAYLAPEMLRRSGHSRSVDWYLFGVLFYELIVGSPPYYSSNREKLFDNIQRGKLKMPTSISHEAKNIIKLLLQRDPSKRLGASKKDAEEVKNDPFFKGVNWVQYLNRQIKPPSFHPVKRVFKEITQEKMFGKLEEDLPTPRLDGWSVLEPSR